MSGWVKLVNVLQALLTPVIGAATVVIAWLAVLIQRQQAKTNSLQLRLALFEKRMNVFNSTMELLTAVMRDAKVELDQLFDFVRETRESVLLFGPEIEAYINDVYKKGGELHARGAVGRQADIQRNTELVKWFSEQSAVAREKFLKYIDFRQP